MMPTENSYDISEDDKEAEEAHMYFIFFLV